MIWYFKLDKFDLFKIGHLNRDIAVSTVQKWPSWW